VVAAGAVADIIQESLSYLGVAPRESDQGQIVSR